VSELLAAYYVAIEGVYRMRIFQIIAVAVFAACVSKADMMMSGGMDSDASADDKPAQKTPPPEKQKKTAEKAAQKNASKNGAKKAGNPEKEPLSPYEVDSDVFISVNEIDESVLHCLKILDIKPAKLCSDAVFARRVYLDLTASLPTEDEVRAFLADKSPDKRGKLVDKLLASEKFATLMTMRFGDMLRIKAEFPINLWPNAAQAYSRFIYDSLVRNDPYGAIVRKILTSEGSNFREGEVNFFRAMQARNSVSIASCAALSFMGMRYEKMPETARHNLAAFFDRLSYKSTKEWKEEIVFADPAKRAPFSGTLPDGSAVSLSADADPRAAFADWLTKKGNPYFSRAAANRIWSWLFGRAIVSPVDDMFADNRAVNAELLDALALKFEAYNFDIRKLCRLIVMSRTYQQSPIPRAKPSEAAKYFAAYPVRQLEAETAIDVICEITGTGEIYESTTPEPYTKFPSGESAVALPDGSVTTSFLELFGRPSRDTGLDSERAASPSASQKLYMINSAHIRSKIENGAGIRPIYSKKPDEFLDTAYLLVLSRFPTKAEREAFYKIRDSRRKNDRGWTHYVDTVWALFNSEEFINKH